MKKIKWGSLIIALLIPLAVGTASGIVSQAGEMYGAMIKPEGSPPAWVFPVVWTALFALMGISSFLIYNADANEKSKMSALILYAVQLVVNFMWPIFFFRMGAYLFSFIWLVLLWALVLIMIIKFYKINRTAAFLQLPYIFWLTFAGYLNLAVYLLNK